MIKTIRSLALVVLVAASAAAQTTGLKFFDRAASVGLVYPVGPSLTVDNPGGVAGAELWVIRLLDGAVVRTYAVKPMRDPMWHENLELKERKPLPESLPPLVTAPNVPVPFRVFLIGPDHVVHDSHNFTAKVNVPRSGTPASLLSPTAYITAGKFEASDGDKLTVTPWDGKEFSATSGRWTKVSDSTKERGTSLWDDFKKYVKPGDELSVIYTEKEGNKVAQHIFVSMPSRAPRIVPPIDPDAGLRFEIGTVASRAEVAGGRELLLTIKDVARRWRVGEKTRILRGVVPSTVTDIKKGGLVALGAPDLKGTEVLATSVLLLTDLSRPTP